MQRICLFVDPSHEILTVGKMAEIIISNQLKPQQVKFADSYLAACQDIKFSSPSSIIISASSVSPDLIKLLETFQDVVGLFPSNQIIVCDEPSPNLMATVFEFGIEEFWTEEELVGRLNSLIAHSKTTSNDEDEIEFKIQKTNSAIISGFPNAIEGAAFELEATEDYDVRSAFTLGKANLSIGKVQKASKNFEGAIALDKNCRSAISKLGETSTILKNFSKAEIIYDGLIRTNPGYESHKLKLAQTYFEQKKYEQGEQLLKSVEKKYSGDQSFLLCEIYLLLCQENWSEAIDQLDAVGNIDYLLTTKINQSGSMLSRAGNHKQALDLYNSAYPKVAMSQKYKLSYNAAIAKIRRKKPKLAQMYLSRCEQEYGGNFKKLNEVRIRLNEADVQ